MNANDIWRNFELDGVSASGAHEPVKQEIREWGTWVESIITAFISTGGRIYQTRAALYADLAWPSGTLAWVMEDTNPAYNGIYRKTGASGSGAWVRAGDLPFGFVKAGVSGGTVNAVQVTTTTPYASNALFIIRGLSPNTATPVTITINGGPALTVKTASGSNVPVNGMPPTILGTIDGANFRLASDIASASIVAAAQDAADRAEAAAAEATALASGLSPVFATKALAAAYSPTSAPSFMQVVGFYAAGDGGGALYKRVASEPSHQGKYSITVQGGGVNWYEIAEKVFDPRMFGATIGAATNQTPFMNNCHRAAELLGVPVAYPSGVFKCDTPVTILGRLSVSGAFAQGALHTIAGRKGTEWNFSSLPAGSNGVIINGTETYLEGGEIKDIAIVRNSHGTKGDNTCGLGVFGCANFTFDRLAINKFDRLIDMACAADRGGTNPQPNVDINFIDMILREAQTEILRAKSSIGVNWERGSFGSIYTVPDRLVRVMNGTRSCDTWRFDATLFINYSVATGLVKIPQIVVIEDGFLHEFHRCVFEQSVDAAIKVARPAAEGNYSVLTLIVEDCHMDGVGIGVQTQGGRVSVHVKGCRIAADGSNAIFLDQAGSERSTTKIAHNTLVTVTDVACVAMYRAKGMTVSDNSCFVANGTGNQPAITLDANCTYNRIVDNDTTTNFTTTEGVNNGGGASNILRDNKRF